MKKITDNENKILQQIFKKTAELQRLDNLLKKHLDAKLAMHCQVANFRQGILVIALKSPAWTMPLRYASSALLTKLRTEEKLYGLSSIQHYVDPNL